MRAFRLISGNGKIHKKPKPKRFAIVIDFEFMRIKIRSEINLFTFSFLNTAEQSENFLSSREFHCVE